jgi:probable HAF family extracellular repeat protein
MRDALPLNWSFLLAFALVPAAVGWAAPYSISSIGETPETELFFPTTINSSGQVAGFIDAVPMQSFVLSSTGATNIGSLGDPFLTLAFGINNVGEITGYSAATPAAGFPRHAFLYSNGVMTDLGSLGQESFGQAINNNSHITGYYTLGDETLRAFFYSNGTMTDLGALPGDTDSQGLALNDTGDVVGRSYRLGENSHAFLYSHGIMTDLGSLGGQRSTATAINNARQVVGTSGTGLPAAYTDYRGGFEIILDETHAFLYSGTTMTDLGTLGGYVSKANAINDLGLVVGESEIMLGDQRAHAFLYSDGTMLDLNTLIDPASGWVLARATDINNLGQIVGIGLYNGRPAAFLLIPSAVPEPTACALAGLAMIGTVLRRRRRHPVHAA